MAPDPFNPYGDLYANPQGVGDKRPTSLQVVQDQGLINAYTGKVALVTGGTNGIGVETAWSLHSTGADVYFTARDEAKGKKIRDDILSKSEGRGKVDFLMMDMDSLESVRDAARSFLSKSDKLNILINNAGTSAFQMLHSPISIRAEKLTPSRLRQVSWAPRTA